jgi:prophage regulatory protein
MSPIFIRISEVITITSLSRSTIYRLINSGEFPAQVPIGCRQSRWVKDEIVKWCEAQIGKNK